MRQITITVAAAAALLLAACGGGGGAPGDVQPVITDDVHSVGIYQASLDRLPRAGARGGVSIRYGTLDDGAGP